MITCAPAKLLRSLRTLRLQNVIAQLRLPPEVELASLFSGVAFVVFFLVSHFFFFFLSFLWVLLRIPRDQREHNTRRCRSTRALTPAFYGTERARETFQAW